MIGILSHLGNISLPLGFVDFSMVQETPAVYYVFRISLPGAGEVAW